jgi:F-type H+-transporting ATPase subunit b
MMFLSQFIGFCHPGGALWIFVVPVYKILAGRTKGIQDRFDELARETREASEGLASIKAKLADIGTETKKRIDAALAEGAAAREQAVAEANATAAAELAKARRTIEIERDKAVLELRIEVARLTLEATEKAVDATMDKKLHDRIVDWYLENAEEAARKR